MRFQEEDESVKSLRTTDDARRTPDGRRTKTDGNSSGELRWANKTSQLVLMGEDVTERGNLDIIVCSLVGKM